MMISVSGMVGSGKSTIANHLVTTLKARDLDAATLRFQSLPCFRLLRTRDRPAPPSAIPPDAAHALSGSQRWRGYKRKRLSLAVTMVYLARIAAFRAYRLFLPSRSRYVLNRYFYDLFVHYSLTTRAERIYFAVLRGLVPVPDLAVLVMAQPQTIAQRRPNYSAEYLTAAGAAYQELAARFPHLVVIRTDPGERSLDVVERLVSERLGAAAR